MGERPNLIVELTFVFSLRIIEYTEILEEKRRYNMANRLFKSGTSIGANVKEAQHAESRKDFIHKMKIAGGRNPILAFAMRKSAQLSIGKYFVTRSRKHPKSYLKNHFIH